MIYKQVQVESYFKKPVPDIKAVLLYGQNEGLIDEYTKKFVKTVSEDLYDPFATAYLDWDEVKADGGAVMAEYNAQSLMNVRRVVVVKEADNNFTKTLEALLDNDKNDNLLLLIGKQSLNNKSSLVSLANSHKAAAAVACYEDREENVVSSVRAILAENAITYDMSAFNLLCSRLSNDRKINVSEIEKLITYVGTKKHFTSADVEAVVFDQAATGMEDLGFDVFSGNREKAVNGLQRLINEGEEEVQIVRSLIRHMNNLLAAKALTESGMSDTEAVKKILSKRLFYRYDAMTAQLRVWKKERLFDVAELLYKAEKDCKTTNMPVSETLSYTVLTLLSAAGKLKRT